MPTSWFRLISYPQEDTRAPRTCAYELIYKYQVIKKINKEIFIKTSTRKGASHLEHVLICIVILIKKVKSPLILMYAMR